MTEPTSRNMHALLPGPFRPARNTLLALAVTGTLLAGCGGGDKQTVNATDRTPGELYFSYPAADQAAVPVTAPVFLRFTRALAMDEDELNPDMLQLTSDQGDVVNLTDLTMTSGDLGIAARPSQPLKPGTRYTLVNQGLATAAGNIELPGGGIRFTTAPATQGPLLDRTEGNGFRVARFIPNGEDRYPATDMSVLRVQFTEPVDEQTLRYGETISLMDGSDALVPAQMYVQGHRVTVDPEEDLDPAQTYTIHLDEGIRSTIADAPLELPPEAPWTFRPLDSTSPNGERERMAQTATAETGNLALSNEAYNSVKLSSLLLGNNNATTATGTVFAELGFIPRFDKAGQSVPLRIDRGALMTGSDVAVNVAGELPAGFSSEAIQVRFLSDANGFLMGNPNTDDENAPRLVELYIDMALNTGNTIANAALGQELLHVHLVGTALVEDGTLTIEAVGVIEPEVMGVDVASGLISFRLEGYRNPADAPPETSFTDNEAPSIKSWVPGEEHQDKMRPGDPVIVYFSEPILPNSINTETVQLLQNGQAVSAATTLNGSALVIRPDAPLSHGSKYSLNLTGLTDIAGHTAPTEVLEFALSKTQELKTEDVGPVALTTLPGYPCAKTDMNEQADKQGRCLGGITASTHPSPEFGVREVDDLLPLSQHESNQPIQVRFSQNINRQSVKVGSSFRVEQLGDGGWKEFTGYQLNVGSRSITATPLSGWEVGQLYRYVLTDEITNTWGVPLYSKLLGQYFDNRTLSELSLGGFNLENRFEAVPPRESVLIPLNNLPTLDVNSNLKLDAIEKPTATPDVPANSGKLQVAANGVDSGVVGNAEIGCPVGSSNCDAFKQFIYKTANLDVEISGTPVTNSDGTKRIPVKLHPSILMTSPLDVWIRLNSDFLALLATADNNPDQVVNTGPMVMRMRYQENNEGDRKELIDGFIKIKDGDLTFETKLDVYLDAPFLDAKLSGFTTTALEDNMRSLKINQLSLSGEVTFLEDGRMQIEQRNVDPISISNVLRGEANVQFLKECEDIFLIGLLCKGIGTIVDGIVNEVIDVDTTISLEIPRNELHLNYISPYTQN